MPRWEDQITSQPKAVSLVVIQYDQLDSPSSEFKTVSSVADPRPSLNSGGTDRLRRAFCLFSCFLFCFFCLSVCCFLCLFRPIQTKMHFNLCVVLYTCVQCTRAVGLKVGVAEHYTLKKVVHLPRVMVVLNRCLGRLRFFGFPTANCCCSEKGRNGNATT